MTDRLKTELRPFALDQAGLVAGWPRSAHEVLMWCGSTDFPVPAATVASWSQEDEVRSRLLVTGDLPLGYGELWLDPEEDEVELARIILAPAARGRGLGRVLTLALLAEARGTGHADVFLRVHPDNRPALRCYQGAGFVPVAPETAAEWNVPQPVDYLWLQPGEPRIRP